MRTLTVPAAVLSLAVLACTETPTNPEIPSVVPQLSGRGEPTITDFSFTRFSPCTGEDIDFTGTLIVQSFSVSEPSPHAFITFFVIFHFQAVGIGQTTDNTYHINVTRRVLTEIAGADRALVRPVVVTIRIISDGSDDNLIDFFLDVEVQSANLNPGVFFTISEIKCVG